MSIPETRLRIGDAEREQAADVVAEAAAAGYLDVTEIDERLERVWSARTGIELSSALSDLPQRLRASTARNRPELAADASQRASRSTSCVGREWSAYVSAMSLMVGVWVLVGLTAGAWYPWVIWPALGWGIALLVRTGRRRPRAAAWPSEASKQEFG